jgi:5,10-methylenetetrahydromethanopterin reductase
MALGISLYPRGLRYTMSVALGQQAETCGYDGVFTVEAGVNSDAVATAQAIALGTSRVTVGTGIANLYLRHPALLGAAAVAVDEFSGGRFILGIGVNNPRSLGTLGIAWRDPREALRDTTDWLRTVFQGGTREGLLTPFRAAEHHIPIHFAGVALETAELAGEIADGLMGYLASRDRVRQLIARAERGATRAGRTPADVVVSLLIPTFLADDLAAARAAARQFLTHYMSVPLYQKMLRRSDFTTEVEAMTAAVEQGDRQGIQAALSDRLMDEICLIGPLARCQERLQALREVGLTSPILAPQPVQEDHVTAAQRVITAFAPR